MKIQPMSAEEWYYTQLHKQGGKNMVWKEISEGYADYKSTYLLKHHLEQFAEELKINGKAYRSMMGMQIDRPHTDKLLIDYLTKNNII